MTVEKRSRAGFMPGVASWCAVWALVCIPPAGRAAGQQVVPADSAVPSTVVTLERAIELALLRDPAAVAAASALSAAEAGELVARGAWLPSVSLNGSYSNSSNQRFDQTTGQLVSQNYTS
ncbi:MAG: TolC family protein, partial [Longimicrobiales bacterium]